MKYRSGGAGLGGANFFWALVLSLALHLVLLWQGPPATVGRWPQSTLPRPVIFLQSSLPIRIVRSIPMQARPESLAQRETTSAPQTRQWSAGQTTETPSLPPSRVEDGAKISEGIDANGLREYRLSLAVATREHKFYPPQALVNGWSGTAEVGLTVSAIGASQPVRLLRSSGHDALDAAAVDMIAKAAQQTALPASLRGQTFTVPLPVVFDINDK